MQTSKSIHAALVKNRGKDESLGKYAKRVGIPKSTMAKLLRDKPSMHRGTIAIIALALGLKP
jgi:hypothetical protein